MSKDRANTVEKHGGDVNVDVVPVQSMDPAILFSVVSAMPCPWFGPIANEMVADFDFTLNEVNWLGNVVSCIYLPAALIIPPFVGRYGLRRCCELGAALLVLSSWIRYAGTASSLNREQAYALVFIGQFVSAFSQPVFQVLGPKYSEVWFDLKGRTTATMVIAISNPVGGAIGQLISPLVGSTRRSILALGIISTVIFPCVFLIIEAPPTPPTYAASQKSLPLKKLLSDLVRWGEKNSSISNRERIDFYITTWIFGVVLASTSGFGILSAQIMEPHGYSADISGFMGACLLLSGIVAAAATAPLFDRVFTHKLAVAAKILVPFVGVGWFSMIWAVRPNNAGALFAILAVNGICSITMLPISLELGCELTRNAEGSSAILLFCGNLLSVIFILVGNALRADERANPPLNMRRTLIFNGCVVLVSTMLVFLVRGKQVRKEKDEQMVREKDEQQQQQQQQQMREFSAGGTG